MEDKKLLQAILDKLSYIEGDTKDIDDLDNRVALVENKLAL